MCGGRNVWNPNCVIAPEQTLVLPVIPQAAGTEQACVLVRETGRGGKKAKSRGRSMFKIHSNRSVPYAISYNIQL